MPGTVDKLDSDPHHDQNSCRWPATTDRPEETPKSERNQRNIDDDEPDLSVIGDEAGHEDGRREHFPKSP
jgi:hypothetical protein